MQRWLWLDGLTLCDATLVVVTGLNLYDAMLVVVTGLTLCDATLVVVTGLTLCDATLVVVTGLTLWLCCYFQTELRGPQRHCQWHQSCSPHVPRLHTAGQSLQSACLALCWLVAENVC